jgi:hypothetical protein
MKPVKVARLPEAEIVAKVIRNFVVKHRKDRYLTMAEKPNKSGGYGFGELGLTLLQENTKWFAIRELRTR